ncbi:MAG: cyclic 2,3-diphosphoglycerate synthase [Bacteroidales bacterium]|jgi:predicted GTPase|nr:cyclic 2,3-diphosphoglycerate synthase [Bacteroidales bacterium]MDD3132474.1 cyclic 2,3-diphosphoglycerate synthase [Bacteroidales bacterium]MDD3527730.1 cyclic 2,3-diphosphoglycerate synthase [Bacteroidales bacterium]MDD4177965.1 cyclic 2,3-diphosphoglycerate synthase [Bacteroidales bacterium]MDD4741494.1 cyclic 2,3-diphosphoglycerate synthase [Bacteroidales bacterium]
MKKNVIIIGAAGRDFHNFNIYYRGNDSFNVVAFTAAQIPDIDGRKYPTELAGNLYPDGIPIYAEEDLPNLIEDLKVDYCVFSYSDVPYERVMSVSALVNASGANFMLLGPADTMVKSTKPLIAVGAVRTGCGKSQTSRRILELLMEKGLKVVAIRHPMPYGNLVEQRVQRFATIDDLHKHKCTVEEMEEYEPHVVRGDVIYAGVDYEDILHAAENDPDGCDVVLWDGGNNDFPFYKPDLNITVVDPHRPGHELRYYPGEVTLRLSDVVVINKMDTADAEDIQTVRESIAKVAPKAIVVDAASPIRVDNPSLIRGKRVLVVEDGPTLTHGEMKIGAGTVAARKFGAAEMIDPRPYTVGKLSETFEIYPNIGTLLPAMGYSEEQLKDLETTINNTDCDSVVIGTPIDLNRLIKIKKPNTRVHYDLQEIGQPDLKEIIDAFVEKHNLKK